MRITMRSKPVRYWFAWRPVWLKEGGIAWLEVVYVDRGFACGKGDWKSYTLAND